MEKIWIANDECNGDVTYWATTRKAYEEARNIIMMNPYPDDEREITKEETKDQDIKNGSYYVYVYSQPFGESWI